MATKKAMTINDGFTKLDDIISQMENSDVSLEDSFELYKNGLDVLKHLNEKIAEVEGKITVINEQ